MQDSLGINLVTQRFQVLESRRLRTFGNWSENGRAQQGFFADFEFRNVENNLPFYLKDFARFAYLPGWRRGEVASLRWEDVDGNVIRLRPEKSKNGTARQITLDGELAELIDRCKIARRVKTETGLTIAELVFHHDVILSSTCVKFGRRPVEWLAFQGSYSATCAA